MNKRKFKKGQQIVSVAEFLEHEWFIVNGKTYHRGWCMSWSLSLAQLYVDRGVAYVAVRLTNREYYIGKSDDELIEKAGDDLCANCPMTAALRNTLLYAVKPIECVKGEKPRCKEALEAWKSKKVGLADGH